MIVPDTATWIWLSTDPNRLSIPAKDVLDERATISVSAISAWEVGMLVAKGRITLDRPVDRWVDEAIRTVDAVPIDHRIGVLATMLPGTPPPDPADRIIVATTLHKGGVLVTPDVSLQAYPFCPTVW